MKAPSGRCKATPGSPSTPSAHPSVNKKANRLPAQKHPVAATCIAYRSDEISAAHHSSAQFVILAAATDPGALEAEFGLVSCRQHRRSHSETVELPPQRFCFAGGLFVGLPRGAQFGSFGGQFLLGSA